MFFCMYVYNGINWVCHRMNGWPQNNDQNLTTPRSLTVRMHVYTYVHHVWICPIVRTFLHRRFGQSNVFEENVEFHPQWYDYLYVTRMVTILSFRIFISSSSHSCCGAENHHVNHHRPKPPPPQNQNNHPNWKRRRVQNILTKKRESNKKMGPHNFNTQ
jgi:NADH:ubiquinone oxidoreductase subunit